MQIGAIAVVVAATIRKDFELDRFFVPKELVLHLTAVVAAIATWGALRRLTRSRVDLLLLGFLLLGAISAALATNPWLAARALAISVSGALLFWVGRALREAGLGPSLLRGLALAVALVAVSSLLQTYGVETELFSLNRAPGGTLGNRNFVAHAAAFGLPLLLLVALSARSLPAYLFGAAGIAIVTGSLVLTRSRAAWLAFGAVVVVVILSMLFSLSLRRDGRTWGRLAGIGLLAAGGIAAAILIPNTLDWRSDNPYLDSVRRVADYEEGSGRGRLIQYERSLRMALTEPIVGVGPGNWAVEYPAHAAQRDPSLDGGNVTFNPWPSSDWVAYASERGFPAAILLALVFAGIGVRAAKQLFTARDSEEGLRVAALLATITAALIAGAFDAVLLLPLPALLVWSALGALWTPPVEEELHPETPGERPPRYWGFTLAILIAASVMGAARSAMQLSAMEIYATREDRGALTLAAKLDPGNYRLRLRLARLGGEGRCAHAIAARDLFPNAEAARAAAGRCE